MATAPRISVIIPTYSRRQILPRTIASVFAQDMPDFELIVVDDCSTDDTRAYLATIADPRLRVVAPPRNVGTPAARNLGLEAARADVVALLDDDDVYFPRRLSVSLAALEGDPGVVCALSSSEKVDRDRHYVAHIPDMTLPPAAFEWALICHLIGVEGSSITVRRAAAIEIGGFAPGIKWHDDREFLIRLARHGGARVIAEPLWQKNRSQDGQSDRRAEAGLSLMSYVAARPDLRTRYRKIGTYFATQVLVADVRHALLRALRRDLHDFRAAGLIDWDIVRLVRDHREVRRYRRSLWNSAALADLAGPPDSWR